ncbi:hypothetical protein JYU12_02845 [bacterium AH-315-K03]|nr:hypothetical protein [bacterium AH-315-K03]
MAEPLQYTEDQRDCLQETCNVATGQTAEVLARKLNAFVTLPIPVIKIIEAQRLPQSLTCFNAQSNVYAASQRFYCEQSDDLVEGLALVLLSEHSLNEFDVSAYPNHIEQAVVQEVCQPMVQTCLDTLSVQWEMALRYDKAKYIGMKSLESICQLQTKGWHKTLVVEIHYSLEGRPFSGDLLLLFPDQAIISMAKKMDDLLSF